MRSAQATDCTHREPTDRIDPAEESGRQRLWQAEDFVKHKTLANRRLCQAEDTGKQETLAGRRHWQTDDSGKQTLFPDAGVRTSVHTLALSMQTSLHRNRRCEKSLKRRSSGCVTLEGAGLFRSFDARPRKEDVCGARGACGKQPSTALGAAGSRRWRGRVRRPAVLLSSRLARHSAVSGPNGL